MRSIFIFACNLQLSPRGNRLHRRKMKQKVEKCKRDNCASFLLDANGNIGSSYYWLGKFLKAALSRTIVTIFTILSITTALCTRFHANLDSRTESSRTYRYILARANICFPPRRVTITHAGMHVCCTNGRSCGYVTLAISYPTTLIKIYTSE